MADRCLATSPSGARCSHEAGHNSDSHFDHLRGVRWWDEPAGSDAPCNCPQSLALTAEVATLRARAAELETENAGLRTAVDQLAERPAKIEAGIRAYCAKSLTSPQFRHLRDGLLYLLESSNG